MTRLAHTIARATYPRCACEGRLLVDWGDGERGTRPASPAVAAMAATMGYPVAMGTERTRWVRVVQPNGSRPPGTPLVTHVFANCGYPTRIENP